MLHSLHWLLVDQRIIYKMAMVTFKVERTAMPAYLSRHLQPGNCVWHLWSLDTRLLCQSFTKTDLARCGLVSVTQFLLSGTHFLDQYSKARQ